MSESSSPAQQVCKFFQRGNCTFGDACQNLHQLATRPPCIFFPLGKCKNGQGCTFAHIGSQPGPTSSTGTSEPSVPSSRLPCKFWPTRTCKKPDTCRFLHLDLNETENGNESPYPSSPSLGSEFSQGQSKLFAPSGDHEDEDNGPTLNEERAEDEDESGQNMEETGHELRSFVPTFPSLNSSLAFTTDSSLPESNGTSPGHKSSVLSDEGFHSPPAESTWDQQVPDHHPSPQSPNGLAREEYASNDGFLGDEADASGVVHGATFEANTNEPTGWPSTDGPQQPSAAPTSSIAEAPTPHWSDYADKYADRNVAFCRFFAKGQCINGYACRFRHSLSVSEYASLFLDAQPFLWSPQFQQPSEFVKPSTVSAFGICKFYPLGKCKNGDACSYLHVAPTQPILEQIVPQEDQSELPWNVPPETSPPSEQNQQIRPCRSYMTSGYCKRGDSCYYSHVASDVMGYSEQPADSAYQSWHNNDGNAWGESSAPREDRPVRTPRRPCKWFLQGTCHRGDQCTFLHERPVEDAPNPADDDDNGWNANATGWDDPEPNTNHNEPMGWGPEPQLEETRPPPADAWPDDDENDPWAPPKPPICTYYARGRCLKGARCNLRHELDQKPPAVLVKEPETPFSTGATPNGANEHDIDTATVGGEGRSSSGRPDDSDTDNELVPWHEASEQLEQREVHTPTPREEGNPQETAVPVLQMERQEADEPTLGEKHEDDTKPSLVNDDENTWAVEWPTEPDEPVAPVRIQRPCKAFGQGYCEFGDSCVYLHIVEPDPTTQESATEDPGQIAPESLNPESETVVDDPEYEMPPVERNMFQCTVHFGPDNGCTPIDLCTASESRSIRVLNLPSAVTYDELMELADQFGDVQDIDIGNSEASATALITYAEAGQALDAVIQLDRQSFDSRPLTARLQTAAYEGMIIPSVCHTVKVTWPAPTNFAWAYYPTITIAKAHEKRLDGQDYEGRKIKAAFFKPRPKQKDSFAVKITNLPGGVTLAAMETFCAGAKPVTIGTPTYTDSPLDSIRNLLESVAPLDYFIALPSTPSQGRHVAFARCSNDSADVMCLHQIPQKFLGDGSLSVQQVYHASYRLSSRRLQAVRGGIDKLLENVPSSCHVRVYDTENPVSIHIDGNIEDPTVFGRINRQVQLLLQGGVLLGSDGEKVWDEYFDITSSAKAIEKLNADTSFFVKVDSRTQSIRVVEDKSSSSRAGVAIAKLLKKVRSLRHVVPLDIAALRLLLDGGFRALQDDVGPNKVTLDVTVPQLVVRGDAEVLRQVQLAIGTAASDSPDTPAIAADGSSCPVCRRKPTDPVKLSCRHAYCQTCLQFVLQASAGLQFTPPRCIATVTSSKDSNDQCLEHVPYVVVRDLLSTAEEENLLRSSFLAYVRARPGEFFFCPSPSCETVYRPGREGSLYRCPSCFTWVCSSCHLEYHEGLSCADAKSL
ncbi:hypothetical protein Hypma_009070 [Hypsizygus marmoreus]|uniref:RING-type E3 ubiquitin transferase n=1 Tax=Hypsizygus marmoreus TaxID=39966 RepID=A0A369JU81_HYPMA|nr:hypothetical protein Hypma_009070 [Hypsizygus marmoreus]